MKPKFGTSLCVAALLGGSVWLRADTFTSLDLVQTGIPYNLLSGAGVPISTTNAPGVTGSNGQLPINDSSGSFYQATPGQFAGWLPFGGVAAPVGTGWLNDPNAALLTGTNALGLATAAAMQLPVAVYTNSAGVTVPGNSIVLSQVQIGVPCLSQQIAFLFGSVIPVPGTDVSGSNAVSAAYWQAQPLPAVFTTTVVATNFTLAGTNAVASLTTNTVTVTNNPYYYSPNANAIFATQPGQISLTWITRAYYAVTNRPAYTNLLGSASYLTNDNGTVSLLVTSNYLVSTTPVKPPQKIYWTEGSFASLGYLINVPNGQISDINVIYNSSFPGTVTTPYQDPYAPTNPAVANTTLWYDTANNVIRAYNVEGRVFVELLGEPIPGQNANEYLGFEIVDVYKTPTPVDLAIHLGEVMTPFQDGWEGSRVMPSAVGNFSGTQFFYQQTTSNGKTFYADRATVNENDMQVYWLTTGVGGLQWPNLLDRYALVWPSDPAEYSQYVRPPAATPVEAALTAVQLDAGEIPQIDYQDPLDQTRGFMTANYSYYSWLTTDYPAHRALLRFTSTAGNQIRFERVFSWLDAGLQTNSLLAGSVVTNLTAWAVDTNGNGCLTFSNIFTTPYVTNGVAYVGETISDPAGELGSTNGYWAGYVNTNAGTLYNPGAYADPFVYGFDLANESAIIPVNAMPGNNQLEVWWFRSNGANPVQGFQPVYWPAIIEDYTIRWPATGTNQIILASGNGTGPLPGSERSGGIYNQPDPARPGYNPNEEHALMLGGQAYALRDDLNCTNGANFTSLPYVLIDYTADDGRPAMEVYQVRREAPELGILFDYVVPAGTQLQPPMPLPYLAPIIGTNDFDTEPTNYSADLPAGWTDASTNGLYALYRGFVFQDRLHEFWVYRGLNQGLPALAAGQYNPADGTFGPLPAAVALTNRPFNYFIQVSRFPATLSLSVNTNAGSSLPAGLTCQTTTNGLSITGTPVNSGQTSVQLMVTDSSDGCSVTNNLYLTINVTNDPGVQLVAQGPLGITSTNPFTGSAACYTNRPPSLAVTPTAGNSFTMRYYYRNLASFAWPNVANPPAVGAIVPYLRPAGTDLNGFAGDPASSNTPSLDIVYRPTWPETLPDGVTKLPTMAAGQTLTAAINQLTAVRGEDSVQVLYQQSIATNSIAAATPLASVVLYDPTVQKKASLLGTGVPPGILTDTYNGLVYFPNLPPNLINRLWYDPNGSNLVFQGSYVPDPLNGGPNTYLLLNVLRGADFAAVTNLYTANDNGLAAWASAVANLQTPVFTYRVDSTGAYVQNPALTVTNYAGDLVQITNADTAVDSYALCATGPGLGYVSYVVNNGRNPALAGDPVKVCITRITSNLYAGGVVTVNSNNANPFGNMTTFQHTCDMAGAAGNYEYDWRIQAPDGSGNPPLSAGTNGMNWIPLNNNSPTYTLGASGVLGLSDNFIILRYRCTNALANPMLTNWSAWSTPTLAEGWIQRVMEHLDPFNSTATADMNNPANSTASLIALAGPRWDGDVPLNEAALTNSGLIQIYETVLNKGKSLSVDSGINYGPANDALLLAAGYLSDLYTTLGNAAYDNSLNPTIGFGTANQTYGSIATAMFCFMGEEPSLLEQNLALLRGRDDRISPGVALAPAYNRLYWNYTYGLDAGEVIYALNYNITDVNGDGVVDAKDAEILYPQGHGDAYGHYLTAMMNYYELLLNPNFTWVPRVQDVTVLGATVAVNYEDERKFAADMENVARTGEQVFKLTWQQDYQPGTANGWEYFATNRPGTSTYADINGQQQTVTGYWGLDHWGARVGQGTFINWVVGNAILPPKDTDPTHSGIQIVDRTTVPELQELPATAVALQADMDNANAGLTPLGLSPNSIPFDINPQLVTGANPQTHFEQVYARAVVALNNAVVAFNDAQNVSQLMRSEQDSLSDFEAGVASQELAFNNQLIELYGTPYPEDIGPGGAYSQGYTGPDLIHFTYVDNADTNTYGGAVPDPTANQTFAIDIQSLPSDWETSNSIYTDMSFIVPYNSPNYSNGVEYVTFNLGADGFANKPPSWTALRTSPGSIQQAISTVIAAQDKLRQALANAVGDKQSLDQAVALFNAQTVLNKSNLALNNAQNGEALSMDSIQNTMAAVNQMLSANIAFAEAGMDADSSPMWFIGGLAVGTDVPGKAVQEARDGIEDFGLATMINVQNDLSVLGNVGIELLQSASTGQADIIADNQYTLAQQSAVQALGQQAGALAGDVGVITQDERALTDAKNAYQALLAKGLRIQQEQQTFRSHAAAQLEGYTTTDAAFALFQNEKLTRYTSLFNLAAQYTYMAANAYDYETGLLDTPAGQAFINQIISSCALGVIENGQPQISGTDTGDPGLANALAEMMGDWNVLQGRLGFNNPDGYGTTVSLRSENYRIITGTNGDYNWQQQLTKGLMPDIRQDSDVMNSCLQVGDGSGAAVPGIVLDFSTTITDGKNLFGQPLGPGDHAYSSSSFATKIFAVGVDLDGYVGMDNPMANSGAAGDFPTNDPTLDPNAMSATPYVYLIPCGSDMMRSPPLGDASTTRSWNVNDVAIPLPFNIGRSAFSTTPYYTAANSLSEPLFATRKHQAFRPVSTTEAFNTSIYGATGSLQPSQYTNKRLIGRSVWNTKWKLVIPGTTLLADPNQGLSRFIASVKDIKLYFVTYSYAGN